MTDTTVFTNWRKSRRSGGGDNCVEVAFAADKGWAGIECLSGIPGLVGATPIQNVGAYGQDVSETIVAVEAMDVRSRARVVFD
jgi:UDP-N-acetylmuramate dehydrogenase